MIVEEKIIIKVNPNMSIYYNSLGYVCQRYDLIEIKTIDLAKGSNLKIKVKCDNCFTNISVVYNKYFKSTKGLIDNYYCKKCNHCNYIKAKITKFEKYGNENYYNTEKSKQTRLKRYGDENYTNKEKSKKTCLEKYGVENVSSIDSVKKSKIKTNLKNWNVENVFQSKVIKDKIKQTNLEKYGVEYYLSSLDAKEKYKSFCEKLNVEHYSQTIEYKSKFRKTCLKRWGYNTSLLNLDIKKKISETNLEKYGFISPMKNEIVSIRNTKSLIENRSYLFKDIGYEYISYDFYKSLYTLKKIECGHEFQIDYDLFRSRINHNNNSCLVCYPKSDLVSIKEKEVCNWLKSIGINIIENNRGIIKKEIDIYLPDYRIAIEFNGLYWHCDKFKNKRYHLEKKIACQESGIELLYIWEDDWRDKKEIIKSIILSKLDKIEDKISVKDCVIKSVNNNDSNLFLSKNNLYYYKKCNINIGLYSDNELVSLMSIAKINNDFKIIRFCDKLNINVISSFSSLFEYFISKYEFRKITIQIDNSIFDNKKLNHLGFVESDKKSMISYWTDFNKKFSNNSAGKKELINKHSKKGLVTDQILKSFGYYKIWSCENIKWIYNKES